MDTRAIDRNIIWNNVAYNPKPYRFKGKLEHMHQFRVNATYWIGPDNHVRDIDEMEGVLGPNSENIDRGGPIANILVIVDLTVLGPNWKIKIAIVVKIDPGRTSKDLDTSIWT